MTKLHYVKKSRKTYRREGIKKGECYWWWSKRSMSGGRFGKSLKIRSRLKPKPSQLATSLFEKSVLEIREGFDEDSSTLEDITERVNRAMEEIETLQDGCQTAYDNLPESLKETSSSGKALQQRISGLENWRANLEAIDFEVNDEGETDPDLAAILEAVRNAFPEGEL